MAFLVLYVRLKNWIYIFLNHPGIRWGYGDPHIKTEDGKTYDFQGRCSYYYLTNQERSFNITIKNQECGSTEENE